MARLPVPGSDANQWGDILNDFLSVEHHSNGSLKKANDINTAHAFATSVQAATDGQILSADSSQSLGIRWKNNPEAFIHTSDYGVTANGSTNDAAAFQQAIDAAIAAGKPVRIQPGTILIGTPLVISGSVTIIGSGREASILKATNGLNDYVIKFTGGTPGTGIVGTHFADFAIDGNCVNQTGGGGILANGAVQCSFERLHLYSVYDWGLQLGPMTGGGFGHHNRVVSCLFDNSQASAGYGGGATTTSNDENWFIVCDFEFLGGDSNPVDNNPIMLYDHSGLQYIANCNFVSGGNNCIAVRIQNTKGTKIVGCIFDGVSGDGVFIAASRCIVTNNVFSGTGDNGNAAASSVHTQYGATNNIIAHNIFESSAIANRLRSHVREEQIGNSGPNLIVNNTMTTLNFAPTVAAIESAGNNTVVRGNLGWVTESNGTATIANGTTSIAVAHGLSTTPVLSTIAVTPTNNLGNATKFWVSGATASQFTITVDSNPGATTATFAWMIRP